MNPTLVSALVAAAVTIAGLLLNRVKLKAEVHSLDADAADKISQAAARVVQDQGNQIAELKVELDELRRRLTLAEARAIKSEAEAALSKLAEARCIQELIDVRREIAELRAQIGTSTPSGQHIVTTVTTVDAPQGETPT